MELPNEFKSQYESLFKNKFEEFLSGFQKERSYGLRLNTIKCKGINNNTYLESILERNPLVEHGYYYDKNSFPGRHPYHHAGVYYLQDPSAMMVIENADIKENDVVFDMCAAPGGKSTHIISKLNNTGLLVSNEIIPKRARILSENIERMGAQNTIVLSVDPMKLSEEFNGFFDKVIVDAPCSGEGMFRKDSDAIALWSVEKIKACSVIQKDLLDVAYRLVKQNGLIIYSTCTFSPQENEEVISHFLDKYNDMELTQTIKNETIENGIAINNKPELTLCSRFYFHKFNGEGHFIAKLRKTGSMLKVKKTTSKSLKEISKEQTKILVNFSNRYLKNFHISNPVFDFNSNLYTINYEGALPNLDKVSILRYGLHLGEIKKDRFEPSHSFALALTKDDVKYAIDFPSQSTEIIKYLSGETISYPGNNHYTLITVDNFSIGWAKHVDNVLKNFYPKGLRIMK